MPELPEVEALRSGLEELVTGRLVIAVEVHWGGCLEPPQAMVVEAIAGDRITGVARRGKVLIILLDSGRRLLIHLRMTGQLVVTQGRRTGTCQGV